MSDADAARALLSAAAVRERAHEMLAAGLGGALQHFTVDLGSLTASAHVVSEMIRVTYPDLKVPFHARWRHFVLGGRDLWAERAAQVASLGKTWRTPAAKARAASSSARSSSLRAKSIQPALLQRPLILSSRTSRASGADPGPLKSAAVRGPG